MDWRRSKSSTPRTLVPPKIFDSNKLVSETRWRTHPKPRAPRWTQSSGLFDAHNQTANAILTSRDAQRAYEEALDGAAKSLEENGKTLDDSTPAGRANAEALDQIANAWNKLDAAGREAMGGITEARKRFEDAAVSVGMARDQARELSRMLLSVEPPPPINIVVTGVGAALNAAATIGTALGRLRDKEITVTTRNQTINANGGVWDYFANGGVRRENHVAQIAPAGSMRVWAEPETGGEAYIPLSPAKRPRSRVIAEQTIGMLGGSVEWFANGGVKLWGRYDDFSELDKSSKLDLARQQQRIRDLENSLSEKETYGKGKNKKRRLALRGLDRRVVQMELREARSELTQMKRENAQLKFYGTEEQEKARKDAEEAAVSAAEEIVRNAAERRTSAKNDAAKTFNIDTSMSAASVDRNLSRLLADSETFLGLLGDLKAKGASPWLLQQLVDAGPTRGAIRLARQYNTDQAALESINKRASQIDQYTNDYASLVGKEAFSSAKAWNSGISSASTSQFNVQITSTDILRLSGEIGRVVRHEITAIASGSGM